MSWYPIIIYLIYDFPFRCSFPWFLVQEDDDDDGDDDDEPPIPPPTAGAQGVTETGAATQTPPDSRSLLKSGVQDCKWIGGLFFLYFWKKHIFRRAAMNLSLDSLGGQFTCFGFCGPWLSVCAEVTETPAVTEKLSASLQVGCESSANSQWAEGRKRLFFFRWQDMCPSTVWGPQAKSGK